MRPMNATFWRAQRGLRLMATACLFVLLVAGCGPQQTPPPGETPLPPTVALEQLPPTNPQVVAQRPYPGEELPLEGSIDLYFDQPMDRASVESALSLNPALTFSLQWVDDSTLRITPAAGELQPATRYRLTVDEAARSAQGLALTQPFETTLQTIGFLAVGDVVPAPDAAAVEPTSVISVIFNRPVVPLGIAEEMPGLPQPLTFQPDIPGRGEWINTSIYMWTPAEPLAGGQTYRVTVRGDLTDQTGAVMEEPYSWSFSVLPPDIIQVTPSDGAVDVALDQPVEVMFNQPMDRASAEAAFSLTLEQGGAVAGSFGWDEESRVMTFTPADLLPLDGAFVAGVAATARSASGETNLVRETAWRFSTVHTPAVRSTTPANGDQGVGVYWGLRFQFTAPMDQSTLTPDLLVVNPPLPEQVTYYYSDYDWSWNVNAALEPSTTYTVTLLPGAADPYGNTINAPYTFSFTTGPLDPVVQPNVQGLFGVYDASRTTELFVLHRNISRMTLTLAELDLRTFGQLSGPSSYERLDSFRPTPEQTVRQWTVATPAELNEAAYVRVPVVSEQGGSLDPGFYLLIIDAPEIDYSIKHFMLVVNANLTYKQSFDESLVWLTDLESGQPIPGADVTFYNPTMSEVASGTTDAEGVAEVETPHTISLWQTRYALVEDGDTFAVAMTDWADGILPWDFGLYGSFDFQDATVYLYTERPLYRPGQEVYFKGIIRDKDDVTYTLPPDQTIRVAIYNDQGDEVYNRSLPISEFGTFNGALTLDSEASLGYYTIDAQLGQDHWSLGFQVAEYRKPEFIVTATPAEPAVLAGGTIRVTVDAEFFFGGPVSQADVTWTALADRYFFAYEGPGNYSFSDFNYDEGIPEEGFVPGFGEVIADGSGTTNAEGEFVITLPASLDAESNSQRFTIEAGVTDINGVTVYGRAEVIVHRGQYYVGVSPDVYVGLAGEEQSAGLLVVDWESQPVARAPVTVQVYERRWSNVLEEDEQGRTQWVWSVEDIPVGTPIRATTDALGKARVTFVPPTGGAYKILATVTDPRGNQQRASAFMWVSGAEYVSWRQANNDRIDLIADRTQYRPGDTAEILIASPFQGDDVRALITVERGSVLSHEVITLPSNSTIYRLPITGEHAPNVYVTVTLVKGVDETNPVPAFKMGMVELQVDPVEQTVQVELTPNRDKVGPGEEVTYTVRTTDFEGDPVDAEVSLALVDLALLSLAPPNSGPIVDHFYGLQGLGVRTAIPLIYLVDRRNQALFDLGKGGGGGGAEGFFDVRTEFRDTAYWSADVRTGSDGTAEVTLTLPDNLTTWRMDARAVTGETLVGQAQVDIVATKPLLIRPQTPRFFVANDEATLSAVVNNNTPRAIQAMVSLDAQGVTLSGDARQRVSIPANGRVEVAWPVTVNADAEWVNLVFSVEGGGLNDASKPPLGDPAHDQMLPVYRYEVPEMVSTAGQLAEAGQRNEGVVLPPTYEVTQGQVRVQIDSSLAASTLEGLDYLRHYEYECTEQVVSKFLPNALTLVAFREFGLDDASLENGLEYYVGVGLQKLYAQQHVDGGWGWFAESPSSPTVTAYAIQGMVAAEQAGMEVEDRVVEDGITYLVGQLRPLNMLRDHSALNRQAYILYVLALADRPDASRTVQLYENRQGLQHWARALLAQTLWMIDPEDPRLAEIQSDLINAAILSATGAHWEEEQPDRWNWNTDTRSTAIILDTFALLWPEHGLGPNITRWLMVARQGGHWETTQETAWALIGLTHWMAATGELDANYQWQFSFNGAELASGQATRDSVDESTIITIDVADLVRDEVNRLLFERTAGAGRMYYTAHLTAYLPVEEVDPLSRGVIVSRRYLDENGDPVTQGRVGEVLTVEVTIIAPRDLYYVVVEDPYPAGAEAVDVSLLTESVLGERPVLRPDDPLARGWGWWWFSQTDLRDEKAVLFADVLPAGTYQYTYSIRLGLPGEYRVIPTVASEFYFPEVYGRGEGMLFTVLPE